MMTRTVVLGVWTLASFIVCSLLDRKSESKWAKRVWYASFLIGCSLIIATGVDAFRLDRKLEKLADGWTVRELSEGKKLQ